jgi:prepilin peptidase CpaA
MNAEAPTTSLVDPTVAPQRSHWSEIWAAAIGLSAVVATMALLLRPSSAHGLFLLALCFAVALLAAGFDAATGRIPKQITYTGIVLGLGLNCADGLIRRHWPTFSFQWLGAAGPTQSLYGLLLFGGMGIIGVLFAGMGGGDMKLLAAVGAILGISNAGDALLCGYAIAIVYSLANLLVAGRLTATIRAAVVGLLNWVYLRERPLAAGKRATQKTIPLAIPLLIGLIISRIPAVGSATGWLLRAG